MATVQNLFKYCQTIGLVMRIRKFMQKRLGILYRTEPLWGVIGQNKLIMSKKLTSTL